MKTPRRPLVLAAVLVMLASSGCVSSRYKLAAKDTPPPVPLNLTSATAPVALAGQPPPLEAVVHTVIACRGAGSWKRDAYWDEYVVSIINRGAAPLTVDSATLTDFRGESVVPEADPWALEKSSRSYEARIGTALGNTLMFGAGMATATAVGFNVAYASAMAGSVAGAWAGIFLMPVYATGTVYKNLYNKRHIEDEFKHRRIALPAWIGPIEKTQGSFFFRIAPGPQRLVLRGQSAGQPVELAVDLAPLASLHLRKPAPEMPAKIVAKN